MLDDTAAKPAAAFIGLPPKYHGALEDPNANIEVSNIAQISTCSIATVLHAGVCFSMYCLDFGDSTEAASYFNRLGAGKCMHACMIETECSYKRGYQYVASRHHMHLMPVLQLEMAKAGVNLFVEKPLSLRPAAEVAELAHQLKLIQEKNK